MSANAEHWPLFALAAALERAEIAECEAARARVAVERLRAINPVMVKSVAGDPPPAYPEIRWSWRAPATLAPPPRSPMKGAHV